MSAIHPDWDAKKAAAHLADLEDQAERAEAIADAFHEAAEEYHRTAIERRRQIAHCVDLFSKPRVKSEASA